MNGSNELSNFNFSTSYPGQGDAVKQASVGFPLGQNGLLLSNNQPPLTDFDTFRGLPNVRSASLSQLPETRSNVVNVNGKLHLLTTSAVCQTPAQNASVFYNSGRNVVADGNVATSRMGSNFDLRSSAGDIDGNRTCAAGQLLSNLRRFNSPSSFNVKNSKDSSKTTSTYPINTPSRVKSASQSNSFSIPPDVTRSSGITSSQLHSTTASLPSAAPSVELSCILPPPHSSDSFLQTPAGAAPMDTAMSFPFADQISLAADTVSDDLHKIDLDPGLLLPGNGLLTAPIAEDSRSFYDYSTIDLGPVTSSSNASQNQSELTRTLSSSSMKSSMPLTLPPPDPLPDLSSPGSLNHFANASTSIHDFDFSEQFSTTPGSQHEIASLSSPNENDHGKSLVDDLDINSDAFSGLDGSTRPQFSAPLSDDGAFNHMTMVTTNQIHAPVNSSAIFSRGQMVEQSNTDPDRRLAAPPLNVESATSGSANGSAFDFEADFSTPNEFSRTLSSPGRSDPSVVDHLPTVASDGSGFDPMLGDDVSNHDK